MSGDTGAAHGKEIGNATVVDCHPTVEDDIAEVESEESMEEEARPRPPWWTREGLSVIVDSPVFMSAMDSIILLNVLFMVIEGQCKGNEIGADLGERVLFFDSTRCSSLKEVFAVIDYASGLAFSVELFARLFAKGCRHLLSPWAWVDVTIVSSWYLTQLGAMIGNFNLGFLRVARTGRLLRVLRLVRKLQNLHSLFLMTTAIRNSFHTLVWASLLLLVIQGMMALVLQQALGETLLADESVPLEDRQLVHKYFGTVSNAWFSMFELTFANWAPIARMMSEKVSVVFSALACLNKLCIGFAVVGVINGVFMQETMKAASIDDKVMISNKARAAAIHKAKMQALFDNAGKNDNGSINRKAFRKLLSNPEVKLWLASMELDSSDVDNLFTMMDDGDGLLTADELVSGAAKLKGTARSLDVAYLSYYMRGLADDMAALRRSSAGCEGGPPVEQQINLKRPPQCHQNLLALPAAPSRKTAAVNGNAAHGTSSRGFSLARVTQVAMRGQSVGGTTDVSARGSVEHHRKLAASVLQSATKLQSNNLMDRQASRTQGSTTQVERSKELASFSNQRAQDEMGVLDAIVADEPNTHSRAFGSTPESPSARMEVVCTQGTRAWV